MSWLHRSDSECKYFINYSICVIPIKEKLINRKRKVERRKSCSPCCPTIEINNWLTRENACKKCVKRKNVMVKHGKMVRMMFLSSSCFFFEFLSLAQNFHFWCSDLLAYVWLWKYNFFFYLIMNLGWLDIYIFLNM